MRRSARGRKSRPGRTAYGRPVNLTLISPAGAMAAVWAALTPMRRIARRMCCSAGRAGIRQRCGIGWTAGRRLRCWRNHGGGVGSGEKATVCPRWPTEVGPTGGGLWRADGGAVRDVLDGASVADSFYVRDGQTDALFGGAGNRAIAFE